MLYLFVGQDSLSKDLQFKKLKEQLLPKKREDFNLDVLYSRELNLKELQEKLLCFPFEAKCRIVLLRDAQALKEENRDFLLGYARAEHPETVLVLDFERFDRKDVFQGEIQRYAKVFRFKETVKPDAFALSRYILSKNPAGALRLLSQLLKDGERPERILGGLRYAWERDISSLPEMKKKLKSLLNCDIEIKTGKLKPVLALEKMVISLCGLRKPLH
jgi:DNA polymerase III delta subunit